MRVNIKSNIRGVRAALLPTLLSLSIVACDDSDDGDTGTGGDADAMLDTGSSSTGVGPGTTSGGTTGGDESGTTGMADTTGGTDDPPPSYEFTSRFAPGQSSVAHSGQAARHVLIDALNRHIAGLTGQIDSGTLIPVAGQVAQALDFYFRFDSATSGGLPHGLQTTPPALQTSFDEVSTGKDLVGKLAGNDPEGQHMDWSLGLVGWADGGTLSPEALIDLWFARIDALAAARATGDIPVGPQGEPVAEVYVDAAGRDYRQLVQKFLLGAITFSQAADDYLDDDLPGKGLLADNLVAVEGKPYTALEHAWDEGFGYFGAAHAYGLRSDDENADTPAVDANADGAIDLTSEYNFGNCVNAAKRDRGSHAQAPTDFSAQAMGAFLAGRHLIASQAALDDAALAQLRGHRDLAITSWEKAVAATVVHYINDVIKDMRAFGTVDYAFEDHAKHWSELKGFALGLQFNRSSALDDAGFAHFHQLVGDAPVLPNAPGAGDYQTALLQARALIGQAYGFHPLNLGDENGEGGW